jgi:hypothetical protein
MAAGERVAAAGSNAAAAAAAAGSNAAATLAAARVPLPTEQQVDAAAEAAGFASGAVVGGVRQGWCRVKQGLSSFLGGGRPVAHAARAGSVDLDEVFMDHNGELQVPFTKHKGLDAGSFVVDQISLAHAHVHAVIMSQDESSMTAVLPLRL